MAEEDFLSVDKEIPSQKFGVFSFISPEKVLKRKDLYFMSEFLKYLCNDKDLVNLLKNAKAEKLEYDNIKTKYDDFIFLNEEKLENTFHEMEDFKTTVRGFKARGNYSSIKEANIRAEVLRKKFPHDNIFVGQVGYWLPWDPNPDRIENQQYSNDELNKLMKKYNENRINTEILYEKQKEEQIKLAKLESEKNKKLLNNNGEANVETQVNVENNDKNNSKLFDDTDPWMSLKNSSE